MSGGQVGQCTLPVQHMQTPVAPQRINYSATHLHLSNQIKKIKKIKSKGQIGFTEIYHSCVVIMYPPFLMLFDERHAALDYVRCRDLNLP